MNCHETVPGLVLYTAGVSREEGEYFVDMSVTSLEFFKQNVSKHSLPALLLNLEALLNLFFLIHTIVFGQSRYLRDVCERWRERICAVMQFPKRDI